MQRKVFTKERGRTKDRRSRRAKEGGGGGTPPGSAHEKIRFGRKKNAEIATCEPLRLGHSNAFPQRAGAARAQITVTEARSSWNCVPSSMSPSSTSKYSTLGTARMLSSVQATLAAAPGTLATTGGRNFSPMRSNCSRRAEAERKSAR